MSDNLDIRARLTAEDNASPQIKQLLDQIKRLEAQLKKGFGKNAITSQIIDPKSLDTLQKGGKAIDGLTQKYMRWARATRDSGQMSAAMWTDMTNSINSHAKAMEKATGKKKAEIAKQLTNELKYAQAYKAVWNSTHRDRLRQEDRFHDSLGRVEAAHMTRRLRAERAHSNTVMQSRRNLMRSLQRLGSSAGPGGRGIASNPAFYAMAAAGGVAAMGTSAVRSARDLDRSETNARINMDQGIVNARQLRDSWALPRSVALGQAPARLMQTAVEASKAGVPEAMAAGTAEMVTQLAKTFGIEVDQAMDGMGYAIAQEMGAGRLKDMTGVRRIGNTAAMLAGKTAARPDQMLSFTRTGLGSGAMLGMDQTSTMAFGAAAIQAGAQGQQAARMLGSMAEDINNLQNRYKDTRKKQSKSEDDKMFMRLPGMLGYGSYSGIQDSFKKDPNGAIFKLLKSFGNIKDPQKRNQAMTALFGADFARFSANMIASPEMLDRTMAIANEAAGQTEQTDFLTQSWGEFMKSLEFFIDRVKAAWSVVKSELGDVLKPFIEQFSDWVGDWYNAVRTSGIKQRFQAVLEGLTTGFLGKPGTFRDLLDKAFGKPGEGNGGQVESFFKFAKGFAEGIKSVASAIATVMTSVGSLFGGTDAESMGKMTAQITGLVAALALLAPVITVFASVVSLFAALGTALTAIGASGLVAVLTALGVGVAVGTNPGSRPTRKKGEKYDEWQSRLQDWKKNRYNKSSGDGDPLFQPTSFRSSADQLSNQLDKFGGRVERASFMGGGLTDFSSRGRGGGLQYAFSGRGGGSGLGGGSGSPMDLLKSTPGAALPNFGMGSSGIIKRDNIPSFSGGGGSSADNLGAGLSGNSFLAARRARFGEEIKSDPALRRQVAGMMITEGAAHPGPVVESLMNRMDMTGGSLKKGLYSGFYGPINRGELPAAMARYDRDPKLRAKMDTAIDNALAGSHRIGGFTDQGLPTDPNGSQRGGRGREMLKIGGNEFLDWGAGKWDGKRGHAGSEAYRKYIEKGIAGSGVTTSVPTPAEAIQNVPSLRPNGDASLGGGGSRGSVAIHINGSSHDPEALATLVQRRVDESMNWRTHDSESEYS